VLKVNLFDHTLTISLSHVREDARRGRQGAPLTGGGGYEAVHTPHVASLTEVGGVRTCRCPFTSTVPCTCSAAAIPATTVNSDVFPHLPYSNRDQ
jgi:hypothetical protein